MYLSVIRAVESLGEESRLCEGHTAETNNETASDNAYQGGLQSGEACTAAARVPRVDKDHRMPVASWATTAPSVRTDRPPGCRSAKRDRFSTLASMTIHYGVEETRMGRRVRGMVNGGWGDSGRALTRSPFLMCCKSRQLATCSCVANPHLLYLPSQSSLNSLDMWQFVVRTGERK